MNTFYRFFNELVKENSGRAVRGEPPANFEQAKAKWTRIVGTSFPQLAFLATHGQDAGSFRQQRGGRGSNNNRGGRGGQSGGPGGGNSGGGGGTSPPKAMHNGRLVCFNFNQAAGCGRKQGAPDACIDGKGALYAHYCNFFDRSSGKYCLAKHPRVNFH